jgi:hypothetical protein
MSWAHYITKESIVDNIVKAFLTANTNALDAYFTEADDYLEDFAQTLGVYADDIDTDVGGQATAFLVRRFCLVFLCMRVCQDKAGTNNIDSSPDMDKYYVKYNMYLKELSEVTKQITPEVLMNTVNSIKDRATTQGTFLFRS